MKMQKIFSIYGILLILGVSSCSDFLESENKSSVTADKQFSTITGWNQLLNQAYFEMRSVYSDPKLFCAGTDMYDVSQGNSRYDLMTYNFNSENEESSSLYTNAYAAINAANCVLKYSSDAKINDQAIFIRDYCYYILTQQFGGVPYITEYIESANSSYPRVELSVIYKELISDLSTLISNGNLEEVSASGDGKGRASIIAAKALLSKVYLAAGWDLSTNLENAEKGVYSVGNTEYFALAAKYASEVADAVPLNLSFAEKWNFDLCEVGNNPEILFAIQYDRATSSNKDDGGHSQQHYFGGYMGSNSLGIKALRNDLCPSERVYYAYEKGDSRFEDSFMTTIYDYDNENWGTTGYWAYYNVSESDLSKLPIAWKFFPWYTTTEEIDSYVVANASRFVTTGYKNVSQVYRVADVISGYTFTASGVKSSYSNSFAKAYSSIGFVPCVKKFDDKNTTSTVGQSNGDYRDIVVLNASEIYLVAAEAYLLAGDKTNSLKYLNSVRNRAGASVLSNFSDYKRYDWALNDEGGYVKVGSVDSNELTITELDVILDERMRETLGEYYRWMDLRRTKQLVRYNIAFCGASLASMTGNDGQIKWLRPIPSNEIQLNTGMTYEDQNPGFKSE